MPRNEQDNSIEETNDWMDYLSNLNYDSSDSEDTDGLVEEDFDTSLDDLMSMLDQSTENPVEVEAEENSYSTDDDFLNMFMNMEDDSATDYDEISSLINSSTDRVEQKKKDNVPMDVGDVFSDALKVVSSLKDDMEEEELLGLLPDQNQSEDIDKKNKKKQKRKILKEMVEKEESVAKEKPVAKEKKKLFAGGMKGIFSKKEKVDVTDKTADDEIITEVSTINIVEEPKIKEKTKKKEKVKKAKKQKPKSAAKKAKGISAEGEEAENSKGNNKGKKTKAAAIKKPKVKEEKKKQEIIEVIDELEENEGKINRLAAALIIFIVSIMAVVVIAGTNLFSYTASIKKATNLFDRQKYTQAYNEVYGMDVKDEDIEIYDKIMTVMYVNKQLNSYNNYYDIGKYPEALDSLLKGLNRYEKYIELATVYGIKSDLDYVRGQILAELEMEYQISEKEAMKFIDQIEDEAYLSFVIDKSASVVENE